MTIAESDKIFVSIDKCINAQKVSLANLIAFPEAVSSELYHDIFDLSDDKIVELYVTTSGFIIGGYVAKIISSYHLIYLKVFVVNNKLKSNKYYKQIVSRVGKKGMEIYGEHFKGIIAVGYCSKNEIPKNIRHSLINKSLFNSGGKLIKECTTVKSQLRHLIYIPYNNGDELDEIKEIFNIILSV